MATRIEIISKVSDARSEILKKRLTSDGFQIKEVASIDVYIIDKKFSTEKFNKIASVLTNPVTQKFSIGSPVFRNQFSCALEIGFLPGVTDNIATTAKEMIEDLLKLTFGRNENIYTSQLILIKGKISAENLTKIADSLYNPLIQRIHIKKYHQYKAGSGMAVIVPKVKLKKTPKALEVNLNVSDEELAKIGKSGIIGTDGHRRGPLALDLANMKAIKKYFHKLGRNPTDIELESLAQTWSEHCKHTIFADPIDDIKNGLFKTYIRSATEKIRLLKGNKEGCVSVFSDNSGAVEFDDDYLITHKVETHNSPSALDPFGGAITGIVAVNRDTIGFGMGAKPIANFYGFCFADPRIDIPLYKGPKFTQKMLSTKRILEGVVAGVNAGGNQSGIPTPSGFVYFDERYRGKPLVFVGTIGLIPKKINPPTGFRVNAERSRSIKGKKSHEKKAKPDDLIAMIGGRVGKDGIHGATFSSEALDTGSPVSAVQIGDPITQKKLSDALIYEIRDLLLYNSITDNGAGGLSCSVAETAKESDGCQVDLEKVPLKYPGLDPWEIWVSESQERMTLAVPQKNWLKLKKLFKKRGVEATAIGKFTNTGKCLVKYNNKKIMDVDLQFLHYGIPQKQLQTQFKKPISQKPNIPAQSLNTLFIDQLSDINFSSYSFISSQFDHIVQGNLVLPPLAGRGMVNAETTAIRPNLKGEKALVLSYGFFPSYSEIDPYKMAACCIDTAVRNVVSAGADPGQIYLLDNFCWCDSNNPLRLGQLKEAVRACYDFAVKYQTSFISGKDSMFNDFKGFDKNGQPVQISIPPTLLISSLGIAHNLYSLISIDAKYPGDLIYILGNTYDELGTVVPQVNPSINLRIYKSLYKAISRGLISSSISITKGGLAVAAAKKSLAGMLGLELRLNNLPGKASNDYLALFSESQGRILVSIDPKNQNKFEKIFHSLPIQNIGKVKTEQKIIIYGKKNNPVIDVNLTDALKTYRQVFKDY